MSEATASGAEVRVRFCPSPTGTPHVGMVRTYLFNWAYTRHTGGTFVFRIEGTDAARDSQESFDQILDSLKWLGLNWGEDVDKGGAHAPYRQSERMDIYAQVAAHLLGAGYAYESYSTPEEIEERHRTEGKDPKLGYNGFDRTLSEEQIAAFKAGGRKPVLRIRMPDEDITFTDLIRGEITFKAGSVPDYVIVRANGHPLYTLVNPVDDALMEITRVLHGEGLLSSTPRQIVLYRALETIGVAKFMPRFGHLPYIMGGGSKKLSKRDPESNLLLHKEAGMIPEGLNNYLALLGWSIAPDRDIFTMSELTQAFGIEQVNPNPTRFDYKKCVAINAEHIRRLDGEDFRRRLVPFLQRDGLVSAQSYGELGENEKTVLDQAAPLTQTRIQLLGEVGPLMRFLFAGAESIEYNEKALSELRENAHEVLRTAREVLKGIEDFSAAANKPALDTKLVEEVGVKPRFAFGPLFVAMTGASVSLPVVDSMTVLGREEVLRRIDQLLVRLG